MLVSVLQEIAVDTSLAQGMGGIVFCDKYAVFTGE